MAVGTSSSRDDDDTTTKTGSTSKKTESDASGVRREAQSQTDQVAMVSRTATGEAHQHPGYEVVGLPDDASEEKRAAAENRPER